MWLTDANDKMGHIDEHPGIAILKANKTWSQRLTLDLVPEIYSRTVRVVIDLQHIATLMEQDSPANRYTYLRTSSFIYILQILDNGVA